MAKRAVSSTANQFVGVGTGIGVNHWHSVATADWGNEPDSLESVMRTGAVLAMHIDDDCWTDLVFANGATASGQLVIYENIRGTAFTQRLATVTPSSNPIAGMGAADLDGDYRLDLVLGNLFAGATEVYRRTAAGDLALHQSLPMTRSTFGFAFGDYDGDGWLDVHAAHWDLAPPASSSPALLRNLGSAGAQSRGMLAGADSEAGTTPFSVPQDFNLAAGFVDLDGDRRSELLIASDFGTSLTLRNAGPPGYVPLPNPGLTDENAAGQIIRDFDNDGLWDWFVASVHEPGDTRSWPFGREGNKLYWGTAGSPFLSASSGTGMEDARWPWGVCAEDFNNDGLTDLFVENGFGYAPDAVIATHGADPFVQVIDDSLFDQQFVRARLFVNQGGRSFVDESLAYGLGNPTNGRGVACFDYDRDGDVDIVAAQNSGPAVFHENLQSAPDGNGFLAIRLLSIAPNTQAVGAVVKVTANGLTQMRQLGANGSFQGQDGGELHFGLGASVTIDTISVQWPGGATETFGPLAANRFLTLLDPAMLPYPHPDRLDRIDAAIASALGFVANPAEQDSDLLLGLSWMQRMHALALPYSAGDVLIERAAAAEAAGDEGEARQLRIWRRSFDPNYQIPAQDYSQLDGFDAVTFAGVYCHQHPLDAADILAVTDLAAGGGYDTTHALLALIWAIDNDCAMPAEFSMELLDRTIRDVFAIAHAGGSATLTDLRIEAMALLAAAGRHDLVQASWVDRVLAEQMFNGGWRGSPTDSGPADHTTGLALWLLLQLAEPQKVLSGFVAQDWDP